MERRPLRGRRRRARAGAVSERDGQLAAGGGRRGGGQHSESASAAHATAGTRTAGEAPRRTAVVGAVFRVEQKGDHGPEETHVAHAGIMSLIIIGLAPAAVGEAAIEGVEVYANLGQLARHVGQDLLADAARGQDGREAIVAPREEVEYPCEESRARGGANLMVALERRI